MPKKSPRDLPVVPAECCDSSCCNGSCNCRGRNSLDGCRVEAVVSIDARGQMVLPKELRERAGFRAGQRLALLSWSKEDRLCCVTIQDADAIAEVLRRAYGPLLVTIAGSTARGST